MSGESNICVNYIVRSLVSSHEMIILLCTIHSFTVIHPSVTSFNQHSQEHTFMCTDMRAFSTVSSA